MRVDLGLAAKPDFGQQFCLACEAVTVNKSGCIDYIQFHKDRRDENGQRLEVRNGHLPEREIISGIGAIKVRQPRVRHRDGGRFCSAILPRFMRRTPSVDALIPALYLKGISTGDFSEALAAILGEKASGLSATRHFALL
jgi:putative transposase